jgi:hypothetical protein
MSFYFWERERLMWQNVALYVLSKMTDISIAIDIFLGGEREVDVAECSILCFEQNDRDISIAINTLRSE